ncbi:hypothetical protein H0H93_006936 [Arthromyces matolae]|nr:hypothetical protein H0H93_006936 [Arthromyces matolae]
MAPTPSDNYDMIGLQFCLEELTLMDEMEAEKQNLIPVSSDADFADVPNIDPSTVKLGSRAHKPQKTTTANKNKNTVAAPPMSPTVQVDSLLKSHSSSFNSQPCHDNENSPPVVKRKRKSKRARRLLKTSKPTGLQNQQSKHFYPVLVKSTSHLKKNARSKSPANLKLKKCELAILQEQNCLLTEKARLLTVYPNIDPTLSTGSKFDAPAA